MTRPRILVTTSGVYRSGPMSLANRDAIIIDWGDGRFWRNGVRAPRVDWRMGCPSIAFKLFACVLSYSREVLFYEDLIESVWGDDFYGGPSSKLEDYIRTRFCNYYSGHGPRMRDWLGVSLRGDNRGGLIISWPGWTETRAVAA